MVKPVKREEKKPYSKPKLTVYGTVKELTQRTGTPRQAGWRKKPEGEQDHI